MVALDYEKTPANKNIALWIGPGASGALGVTDVNVPLAVELNNTGGTSGMISAAQAVSWSDFAFGIQASDTNSEPSLADAANYSERGLSNYGGSMSPYVPPIFGDVSNPASNLFDLLKTPGTKVDAVMRIDGAAGTGVAVDGDMVMVFRTRTGGWVNPFTVGESKRYTPSFLSEGAFAYLTVVGVHTITLNPATGGLTVGAKGRIQGIQQGRDRTAALKWSSSNAAIIEMKGNGVYQALAAGTAIITATDVGSGDTITRSIIVTV